MLHTDSEDILIIVVWSLRCSQFFHNSFTARIYIDSFFILFYGCVYKLKMSTSDFVQRGRRNDDADASPTSKRHESTSSLSNDSRIVPLNSNLGGLSIAEPAHFVACIIPKSLITVLEKVLKETIEKGLATQQVNTQLQSEDLEKEGNNH
jgi:hypothetical protein